MQSVQLKPKPVALAGWRNSFMNTYERKRGQGEFPGDKRQQRCWEVGAMWLSA